mmetsp:Transcript_39408/g.91373  ORF Transcript_39408/g.91373 Transcript_39408/m.91373 type:complete len:221 (+) Transcript_39408:532-1194(+)
MEGWHYSGAKPLGPASARGRHPRSAEASPVFCLRLSRSASVLLCRAHPRCWRAPLCSKRWCARMGRCLCLAPRRCGHRRCAGGALPCGHGLHEDCKLWPCATRGPTRTTGSSCHCSSRARCRTKPQGAGGGSRRRVPREVDHLRSPLRLRLALRAGHRRGSLCLTLTATVTLQPAHITLGHSAAGRSPRGAPALCHRLCPRASSGHRRWRTGHHHLQPSG